MKYPQLVSTRAVNAISDWLVSRLELLGVEAPQIYTRLLLSLLQSSVQINDPIEFSNLEAFFANHKGSNKRYLPCDTDTLKKLNAIQCLREIVSSEQEITTIENLVEELCEKLKDIEQQLADIDDDDKLLISTTTNQHHNQHHHYSQHHNSSSNNNSREEELQQQERTLETDPKKRYFRAFPALSKEMEDSFLIWRRNAKSLTWPVDRNNISSISSSSSSSTLSTSFGSCNATGTTGKVSASDDCIDLKANVNAVTAAAAGVKGKRRESVDLEGTATNENSAAVSSTCIGGVKRKSKRRRNQALSKGKTIQNIRKNSAGNVVAGNNSAAGGSRHHRHSSPTYWDTDFEGCWEMGRDLIKEFIVKQNKNSRNRSTSESAAYNMRATGMEGGTVAEIKDNDIVVVETEKTGVVHTQQQSEQKIGNENENVNDSISHATNDAWKMTSPFLPAVDISFCCDDEYDDTLASISELAADNSFVSNITSAAATTTARRLYQREVSFGSHELLPREVVDAASNNSGTEKSNEHLDFAQFEAKFNSSIEALWKDADKETDEYATSITSLPAVATVSAREENLKNFWANYNSHHYNLTTITREKQRQQQAVANITSAVASNLNENSCASLSHNDSGCASGAGSARATTTSDYYSMPSNLAEFGSKSIGSLRRDAAQIAEKDNTATGAIKSEESNTPIALFLQSSIWSENLNTASADTDESFYLKVWNSSKKLNQLEVAHGNKITSSVAGGTNKYTESTFNFPPYNISKWSEGINAGPPANVQPVPQQQQSRLQIDGAALTGGASNSGNLYNLSTDCTDSSTTASLSTTSCSSAYNQPSNAAATYNWQTPIVGQSLQPDLQSWSASNPMSLTEIYGNGNGAGGANAGLSASATDAASKRIVNNYLGASHEIIKPTVTLPNHSANSSGFVEYARIKTALKASQQQGISDNKHAIYPPVSAVQRPKERYADDENLLTSERTHFYPIKTYADGHTFDICSALDVIDYERSASGYLHLEAERYLEYTRNDNFMAEEDTSAAVSSAPLYASSNCDAARAARGSVDIGKNKVVNNFVIKFRMRNSDVACQTDNEIDLAKEKEQPQVEQHPLRLIFSDAARGINVPATRLDCNDAIEALNKAVAAAAKAAAAAHLPMTDSHWQPTKTATVGGNVSLLDSEALRYSKIWTVAQAPVTSTMHDEQSCCDDIDFNSNTNADEDETSCSALLEQQWSMQEIGKKCQLKGHQNGVNNNNNNNNIVGANANDKAAGSVVAAGSQTLWSMCAACNSELKSVPANRLLRDELRQEADEIMSDLKYMQDLYIGRSVDNVLTSDSEWDEEADAEYTAEAIEYEIDDDYANVNANDIEFNKPKEQGENEKILLTNLDITLDGEASRRRSIENELNVQPQQPTHPQTQEMLQKVNRLIADLLHPDNTLIKNNTTADDVFATLATQKQFSGGLWCNNNERNIWQQDDISGESINALFKPMDLLRQFNVEPNANALPPPLTKDEQFLAQLNWEHDNLASIWQTTPPEERQNTTKLLQLEQKKQQEQDVSTSIDDNNIIHKNLRNIQHTLSLDAAVETADDILSCDQVEREMQANMPSNDAGTTADASDAAKTTAAYRRIQQFLNASALVSATAATNAPTSSMKIKQHNRKRRHSASQNYFQTHAFNSGGTLNNNNNNVNIADLNNFNVKFISLNASSSSNAASSFNDDLNMQKLISNAIRQNLDKKVHGAFAVGASESNSVVGGGGGSGSGDDDDDKFMVADEPTKQTIITCKYWTTIDPMLTSDAIDFEDGGVEATVVDGAGGDLIEEIGSATATTFSCLIDKNSTILKHVTMATRPLTR